MNGWQFSNPAEVPANFANVWLESSMHVLRTAGEFWSGILLPGTGTAGTARARTSTASPWWMPPQTSPASANFTPWMPSWPPSWSQGLWSQGLWSQGLWSQAMPWPGAAASPTSFFLPWMPSGPAGTLGNPLAFWQKMWLDAATPAAPQMWPAPKETAVVEQLWQPVAAAYRTANGHAMAAVFRTMADVVEPKPQGFSPTSYWPGMFGTRH